MLSNHQTFVGALIGAFINTGTLVFWCAIVLMILDKNLLLLRPNVQVIAHILLAITFSVCWYFSVTVLFGWKNGNFLGAFTVLPFSTVAFIWQFFQGVTIYLGILAAAIAWKNWKLLQSKPTQAVQPISKLLVKEGEEIIAIPIDNILCVSGAGDYSEIITSQKRYLTRKRLNELETSLPPDFIRVHRSHLINVNMMTKAESIGGGRLRIYQQNNVIVDSSRTGARLLKESAN